MNGKSKSDFGNISTILCQSQPKELDITIIYGPASSQKF